MGTQGIAPIIERIRLKDFRNYAEVELSPSPGFNIVSGQNAQGKTNLLESIQLISCGRLMRGNRDSQAVRHGAEQALVETTLTETGTTIGVEIAIEGRGSKKRVLLNGASLNRPSDVLGRVPTVSFSAKDLLIVRGEPVERRHFMDSELSQIYPAYLKHLSIYKRALDQRNALLKLSQTSYQPDELFEVWETQMAEHGAELVRFRSSWIESLQPFVCEAHSALGRGEEVLLTFQPKGESEPSALLDLLVTRRADDAQRGFTTRGPHRDNVQIDVGGLDARQYGSQGQQRTAVIALKLAVMGLASGILGFPPVLLLDDVFSDLDQGRRSNLVELGIAQGGQVFLTCTEAEQAGVELVGRSKVFRVVSGSVEEA